MGFYSALLILRMHGECSNHFAKNDKKLSTDLPDKYTDRKFHSTK